MNILLEDSERVRPKSCWNLLLLPLLRFFNLLLTIILPFFLKMPNIIFSVMQKPFIKCVIRQRIGRFLHSRKKLIRRFQKKRQYNAEKIYCVAKNVLSKKKKFAPIRFVRQDRSPSKFQLFRSETMEQIFFREFLEWTRLN